MPMTLDEHGDDSETIFKQDLDAIEGCEPSSTAVLSSLRNEQPGPSISHKDIAPISPQQSLPRETIVTSVTMFFMATELLDFIVEAARTNPGERVSIPHTAATDTESFCWVIMYVVYRRTIDGSELQAEDSTAHAEMKREFAWLFSATSIEGLVQSRQLRLAYGQESYRGKLGMETLLKHMVQRCEPLAGLLLAVWTALWECASFDSDADSDDLMKWRVKALQEAVEAENKERQKRGLPLVPAYNPRQEKPIICHRRLLLSIQRMLEKLDVAF